MKAILWQRVSMVGLLAACSGPVDQDARFFAGEDVTDPAFGQRRDQLNVRADLVTTLSGPASGAPGSAASYQIVTRNIGGRSAQSTQALFTPPAGASVTSVDTGCTVLSAPVRVRCSLSTLSAGASKARTIGVQLPSTPGAHTFQATATTSSAEVSTSNNASSHTTTVAAPTYEPVMTLPQAMYANACYDVTDYAQCTPASLVWADIVLLDGGIVDTLTPDVTGTYSQPNGPSSLSMEFRLSADQSWLSTFTGQAVSESCFRGTIVSQSAQGAFEACLN